MKNPTFKIYYMKEWFEKDKCIRVFDKSKEEEVIILHSEDCISTNNCSDLPENIKKKSHLGKGSKQ